MGKTRRNRQQGGVSRWKILAALAALKGAHAEEKGFRSLVSDWWKTGSWTVTPELEQYLTGYGTYTPETVAVPIPSQEKQEEIVSPYLDKGRPAKIEYPPKGLEFLKGDVTIVGEELDDEEPMWIIEKDIDGSLERYAIEKEFVVETTKGGRKRRHKTLRRKK